MSVDISLEELRAKMEALKADVEAKESLYKRLEQNLEENQRLKAEVDAADKELSRVRSIEKRAIEAAFKNRLNAIFRIEYSKIDQIDKKK